MMRCESLVSLSLSPRPKVNNNINNQCMESKGTYVSDLQLSASYSHSAIVCHLEIACVVFVYT